MHPPFLEWLAAFVWTCALELPVYFIFLRKQFSAWWMPCLIAFLLNALTHPVLWYGFPRFGPYLIWLLATEGWVVIVEAVLVLGFLRKCPLWPQGLLLGFGSSVLANTISALSGLLFFN